MMIRLKDYIDARIDSLQRELTDLRETIIDHLRRTEDVIHRSEYDKKHEDLAKDYDRLNDRVGRMENITKGVEQFKGKIYAAIGGAVGLVTIIVLLIDHFTK